jgi:hypothetical protein
VNYPAILWTRFACVLAVDHGIWDRIGFFQMSEVRVACLQVLCIRRSVNAGSEYFFHAGHDFQLQAGVAWFADPDRAVAATVNTVCQEQDVTVNRHFGYDSFRNRHPHCPSRVATYVIVG